MDRGKEQEKPQTVCCMERKLGGLKKALQRANKGRSLSAMLDENRYNWAMRMASLSWSTRGGQEVRLWGNTNSKACTTLLPILQ
jgi:hypothetical protein